LQFHNNLSRIFYPTLEIARKPFIFNRLLMTLWSESDSSARQTLLANFSTEKSGLKLSQRFAKHVVKKLISEISELLKCGSISQNPGKKIEK